MYRHHVILWNGTNFLVFVTDCQYFLTQLWSLKHKHFPDSPEIFAITESSNLPGIWSSHTWSSPRKTKVDLIDLSCKFADVQFRNSQPLWNHAAPADGRGRGGRRRWGDENADDELYEPRKGCVTIATSLDSIVVNWSLMPCLEKAKIPQRKQHFAKISMMESSLPLCIRETPKQVLLQKVKTQMKCSIMLHFISVYTICKGKKDLQTKEYNI